MDRLTDSANKRPWLYGLFWGLLWGLIALWFLLIAPWDLGLFQAVLPALLVGALIGVAMSRAWRRGRRYRRYKTKPPA